MVKKSSIEIGDAGKAAASLVRKERRFREWTLDALAERLQEAGRPLTAAALSQIEAGRRRIDVDDIAAFAKVFGMQPGDFFPSGLIKRVAIAAELRQLRYEVGQITGKLNELEEAGDGEE